MVASYAVLFASALLAGAINAVAGGGTLLTFPALLAIGVPPIAANATSTVALVPGSFSAFWGYRKSMVGSRRTLVEFGAPSVIGGFLGALIVSRVGDARFAALVPWLIFGATALFMVQPLVRRWLVKRDSASGREGTPVVAMIFQLVVATYGGFFGAGMGILMLATLGILGFTDIHRMNGVKNFAAVCVNSVASLTFMVLGQVRWPFAALMATGAIIGGYAGAGVAKKLGEQNVRRIVVGVGVTIGVVMLAKR